MSKSLVTYFSASGVTANAAKVLAETLSADIYEIKPEVLYTKEDLDYMNPESRSSKEMKDKTSRPAIIKNDVCLCEYETVYVGFPVWWYTAPTIVNSFLESYDFSGKKIVLFATCGSSGFGKALEDLKASAPGSEMCEGVILKGTDSLDVIKEWVENLK